MNEKVQNMEALQRELDIITNESGTYKTKERLDAFCTHMETFRYEDLDRDPVLVFDEDIMETIYNDDGTADEYERKINVHDLRYKLTLKEEEGGLALDDFIRLVMATDVLQKDWSMAPKVKGRDVWTATRNEDPRTMIQLSIVKTSGETNYRAEVTVRQRGFTGGYEVTCLTYTYTMPDVIGITYDAPVTENDVLESDMDVQTFLGILKENVKENKWMSEEEEGRTNSVNVILMCNTWINWRVLQRINEEQFPFYKGTREINDFLFRASFEDKTLA